MSVRGRDYAGERYRSTAARRVRLIVLESGTKGLADHCATEGSDQTVVIAQMDEETATELAHRVVRRVLTLEGANRVIERTILMLSPRYDADAIEARLIVVRALVAHSASVQADCVELLLSAGNESRDQLQFGLPALVNALLADPGTSAVTVGVKLVGTPAAGDSSASLGEREALSLDQNHS